MAVLGAGGAFPQLIITTSQTWTPPMSGNVCLHLVGGGGGSRGGGTTNMGAGGAGGYCKKNYLAVSPANNLTIVVGARGVGAWNNSGGSSGGNTTVAGNGISSTLTANGGQLGYIDDQGVGGTAANGDVNNTGGAGNRYGGGAVGIFGTGNTGVQYNSENVGPNQGGLTDASGGGLAMSQFGVICGGSRSGAGTVQSDFALEYVGEALCGGGTAYGSGVKMGGQGGIGGGGGGAGSTNGYAYCYGGSGGPGVVLIQYLPW